MNKFPATICILCELGEGHFDLAVCPRLIRLKKIQKKRYSKTPDPLRVVTVEGQCSLAEYSSHPIIENRIQNEAEKAQREDFIRHCREYTAPVIPKGMKYPTLKLTPISFLSFCKQFIP